jgi:hypothetical protein
MREKDLQIIELKGLSAHTMELILNCIYTDQVEFSTENVQEILPAASLLQLSDIQTAGADFLESQLDPTNSLGIKQFADAHGCIQLKKAAQEYVYEHFSQVVQNEEFLNLKFNELEDLIKLDEIEVCLSLYKLTLEINLTYYKRFQVKKLFITQFLIG